ncbi:prolyl aminopeptidase [Hyphomicrobiales bacterium]|jgi:proline iminopeptidase|nr:prolyl aminopeptidase [Hyphomicrobiales bacterium]|tara:strand:- start:3641 stop:4612 length:972 start_codon:yes stop_codon:yes gene_type:complete
MKLFSKKNKLFPSLEPYDSGYLKKGVHEIYYEQCGNPRGKPAVFLHGGPGGSCGKISRRFFNPKKYRIILFDQRGCGKSKPHACLEDNTTWHLIEDIESIRKKLNIQKWLVFGGSWGSTLAIAYAQKFPDHVSQMVLRGIFMLRQKELQWFYQYGASEVYPEAWKGFVEEIPKKERSNLIDAYRKIFYGKNEEKKLSAARAWSKWEASASFINHNSGAVKDSINAEFALAFAFIENHYFVNKGFLDNENQLLNNVDIIRDIPAIIIQGRYDIVCPPTTAYELHSRWPESDLIIAPFSGHSSLEEEITHELIKATNQFSTDEYN